MKTIHVSSEIAPLKTVLLHTPGAELDQMTPETAEELLYDDILNMEAAREQHSQLQGVLEKVSRPLQVRDLLCDLLQDPVVKQELIKDLCAHLNVSDLEGSLLETEAKTLSHQLITGTPLKRDTLEHFLSSRRFALPPLPNLFFTRDSAMVLNERVFIGTMANRIRTAEAILMRHIFHHHSVVKCDDFLLESEDDDSPQVTFEGGDILILREDTVLIGMSERTSVPGIDYLIQQFKERQTIKHVFVVILPKLRATIHLDMIFTMIDHDKAVVFPPLILDKDGVDVIHINISNPNRPKLERYPYLLKALRKVDINLEPVFCGGENELYQRREQWQSGANFFTMAPGKIIGYGMNTFTYDE